MKQKPILAVIFICAFSIFASGQVHNIQLVSGKIQVLKGSVRAGEENEQLYIFEAKPDQQLIINISSINDNAVFAVNEQYRVDHPPIEIDGQPVEAKNEEWSGKLPKTESNGLYSVSVTLTKGTATFTLEITLEDSESESSDEMNSTFGQPQDIKDFYLLMPKKYDGKTHQQRKEMVVAAETNETVDVKNGYMRFSLKGDTLQVFEAAIFKQPDGGYILAYNEDYDSDKNPSPTKLNFLSYAEGKWTDVTAQVLPIPVNRKYQYELPQEGTTIQVTKDVWQKMYVLHWKNGKFMKGAKQ